MMFISLLLWQIIVHHHFHNVFKDRVGDVTSDKIKLS